MPIRTKCYMLIVCTFISLFSVQSLYSRELSIPIDDPIYSILQVAEMRGIISGLPGARPYSEDYILSLLTDCAADPQGFSDAEYAMILSRIEQLKETDKDLVHDGTIQYISADEVFRTELGFDVLSSGTMRVDAAEPADIRNVLHVFLQGDITQDFSYRMGGGIRIDRLNEYAWEPYHFTMPNEGFYFAFNGTSDGTNVSYPPNGGLGFDTYPEMAISLLDNKVRIRWGQIDRQWGWGRGSLTLSGTARPFDAVEGAFELADWLSYSYLTGTLTNWEEKSTTQNMFTTKRVELHLPLGLNLALFETCLWIKRFELGYLNPFMITTLYQNILGDYDNMLAGGEFEWNIPWEIDTRLYGSMVVDEMNNINPRYWFKQVRNIFSLQGGIETNVPFLPFTIAGFQYTRLEPFFYTHYATSYPTYPEEMNVNYQNKGVNLGYYLEPNSDEFTFSLSSLPTDSLHTDMTVSYIRHSGQYGSDIDFPIIYDILDHPDKHNYIYTDKDFLNTLIEKTVIVSLSAEYGFAERLPIALSVGYSYAITWQREVEDYDYDDEDDSNPTERVEAVSFSEWQAPTDRHIVHVGFHLYY